jgi:hypothetical protein
VVLACLVAESEEPICTPEQLQNVCSGTAADTNIILCCDANLLADEQNYSDCLITTSGLCCVCFLLVEAVL